MTTRQSSGDEDGPAPCLVVGFDRLPAGVRALEHAAALAAGLGARLVVVHVVDAADAPLDPDSPGWDEHVDLAVQEVRSAAADVLAGAGVPWRFEALTGDPAAGMSLVAAAEDALMVVLGAPRTGLASAMERLLGEAVATRLLRHGHRPVLLVPEDAP